MKKIEKYIIAVITLIVIGAIGTAVYFGVNKDKDLNFDKKTDEQNNSKDKQYTLLDFDKIIDEELDILLEKKSLDELKDEELTLYAYELYANENGYGNTRFTIKDLEAFYKKTSLKEKKFNYTHIYDSYGNYDSYDIDSIIHELKGNNYVIPDDANGGHGMSYTGAFYSRIVDYQVNNNQYLVSKKYIFYNPDGPIVADKIYKDYKSAKDAKFGENDNYLKSFDIEDWEDESAYNEKAREYCEKNFYLIKNQLDTYNYVFEIHDEEIILTDFYVD